MAAKTKEEIFAEMDAAAEEARREFIEMTGMLDGDTLKSLAGWWKRWYLKAGHKRLAWILMNEA